MRVIVDRQVCLGHGQCVEAAPEVFALDEDALVQVLVDHPEETLRAKVVEAAARCPTMAITIED